MKVDGAAARVDGAAEQARLGQLSGGDSELLCYALAERAGIRRFVEPELELDFFWEIPGLHGVRTALAHGRRWRNFGGLGSVFRLSSLSAAPASASDDVAIVHAMARGDSAALARLYDRYAGSMLALARRIVGRGPEAEDVIHDVFLEAWRHAADYDATRGSVKSWLLLRTRSRSLDVQKSARVSKQAGGLDDNWLTELSAPGVDGAASADQQRIRKVLVALPPEQREVLLLGYFEGLSSSEMAERIGVPIGTVKSRVAAALSALRGALSDSIVELR
jgi:RNA polymerase sigma-70 factor (ECF subfamily)